MAHYKDVRYCSVKWLVFPLFLLLITILEGFTTRGRVLVSIKAPIYIPVSNRFVGLLLYKGWVLHSLYSQKIEVRVGYFIP